MSKSTSTTVKLSGLPRLESVSEQLAILHAATVLACGATEYGFGSRPLMFILLACSGFLLIVFVISRKEQQALESKTNLRANKKKKTPAGEDEEEEDFAIAITDVRRNPVTNKVEYRLDGAYNDERWSAWLRYSTLLQLKGRAGPKADQVFPGKTSVAQWVRGSDSDIAFVDERRKMLNRFLKEAVPNKKAFEILAQVPVVKTALGLPNSMEISSKSAGVSQEIAMKYALEALDDTCSIAAYGENGGDGWYVHAKHSDGIICTLKRDGDFTYAMGKGPMDMDKLVAAEFIADLKHRQKWDELFKSQDDLETYIRYDPKFSYPPTEDPFGTGRSKDWEILALNITRTAFSSPAKAFVAERDSVCVGTMARRRSDGAICVALKSIEHPRAPEGLEGYVRAKVMCAGFLFEDRKDGKPGCALSTMGLLDPNGKIPQFVVSMVAPTRALIIRDVNRVWKSIQ